MHEPSPASAALSLALAWLLDARVDELPARSAPDRERPSRMLREALR